MEIRINEQEIIPVVEKSVAKYINKLHTQKELMSRKETMQYLGISNGTIHNWVKDGVLKPYKISDKVYFKLSDIMKTLKPNW